ncbi:MAG TPA: tetratricopeptide repeat protein [Bacteroidia bacterium]|nr:tetratricopeptide repeat protein [Bacteroidia bacterium]
MKKFPPRWATVLPLLLAIWLGLLLLPAQVQAQASVKELLKEARLQYDKEDYEAAVKTCKQALFKDADNVEAYVLRGQALAMQGLHTSALEDLDYAIGRGTKNVEAYAFRAELRRQNGQYKLSMEDLQKAISLEPKNASYLRTQGALWTKLDNYSEALKVLDQAIAIEPDNANGHYLKANALLSDGEYALAKKCFEQALRLDPSLAVDINVYLGICSKRMGKPEEAEAYIQKSLALDSNSVYAWYHLASLRFNAQDYQAALEMLNRSTRIDSFFQISYNLKGESHLRLDQYERAVATLDTAVLLGGDDKMIALKLRADAKRRLGQNEAAIIDYSKAILIQLDYSGALLGRARARDNIAQYDKAMDDLKRAAKLDPENSEVEFMTALVLKHSGQFDASETAFNDYLEEFPDDSRAWYHLAVLSELKNDYPSAVEHYDMALATFNSDSSDVYMRRSYCHIHLEKLKEANVDIDNCMRFPIEGAARLSGVAYALNALGRSEEALPMLNRAISLDSTHAYAFNNRGFAKYKLGQFESAIVDFDRSIALKNDYTHLVPYNRANAKRALGRYEEAIADFDLALSYKAEYFEAFNDRGETWEKLKETEKAIADYEAALKIKPDYLPARLSLERLGK